MSIFSESRPLIRAIAMFFLLAPAGCAVMFPDRTAPKSGNYTIVPPSPPWTRYDAETSGPEGLPADLAYENPDTGANFSLNSLCRKYHDASLETLTTSLVRGIDDRKTVSSKSITVNNIPALDTLFEGYVDKVLVHIRTVVLVKDSCTYDFIYVTVPKKEKNGKSEFEKFVNSFRVNP